VLTTTPVLTLPSLSYKEPLTEYPNLRGDTGFGYGNRSCPGVDFTSCELVLLLSALLSSFTVSRKEGAAGALNPVPWYETNPYVITMSAPFPCDVRVRSEEKRRRILADVGEADAGYTIRETSEGKRGRWDIVRPENEREHYSWEGLTTAFSLRDGGKMPVYPAQTLGLVS